MRGTKVNKIPPSSRPSPSRGEGGKQDKKTIYPVSLFKKYGSVWLLILFLSAGPALGQIQGDIGKSAVPALGPGGAPKIKTAEAKGAHSSRLVYFQDNMESALMKYTTQPEFNAKDPVSLNDLGYLYYYFGDYSEAEAQFQKALDINPAFTDALVNWGVSAHMTGDDATALKLLGRAHDQDPQKGESSYDLGLLAYDTGDFSKAQGFFEEASRLLASNPQVWNNLGCAYFQLKNQEAAYNAFRKSVSVGAAFYRAHYNLALASVLSGQAEQSVEDAKSALKLSPDDPDAANILGLAYLMNGDYTKASVALIRALKGDSNNAGYLNNLGRAQMGLGHYPEAEKALRRSLLFQPDLRSAQWNLADLELRRGRSKEALPLYDSVSDWEEAQGNPVFLYNWGVACYKAGKPEEAKPLWEKSRTLDPHYTQPVFALAESSFESKDFEKSLAYVQQGESEDAQSPRWARLTGDALAAQGKATEALDAYEKAKQLGERDAQLLSKIENLKSGTLPATSEVTTGEGNLNVPADYHVLILRKIGEGNLDSALPLARQAAERWPQEAGVWEDLGSTYGKLAKNQDALEAYQKAQALEPTNPGILEECGSSAFQTQQFLAAQHFFTRALILDPHSQVSYLGLGSCAFKLHQSDKAVQYWTKGGDLFPKSAEFPYNLSRVAYQRGDLAQARAFLQKAKQLKPEYAEVFTNEAAIDLDQDHLDEAETLLKHSLSLDPELAETFFNLGNLKLKRGEFVSAGEYYQKGLQINPDDPDGYYYQGVVYLRQEEWVKARKWLEAALEKNPSHADALYNLGKVSIETEDYDGAMKYFQESLNFNPNQSDAYFGIGLVHLKQGRFAEAKEYFQKAQADARMAPEAVYYLGQVQEKLGHPEEAEEYYRQSIRLKPSLGFPHLALGDLLKQRGMVQEAKMEYLMASQQKEFPGLAQVADNRLKELE